MTASDWKSLLYLKPADFKYPTEMQPSIVLQLDRFVGQLGSRPVIISDYRPGDTGEHGRGLAIDTSWPGHDAMDVWSRANSVQLFSGLGIYVNEVGAVSFHFDARKDRTPAYPATWGAVITHPLDASTGAHVQLNEYTTAQVILDILKKKGVGLILLLSLSLLLYYLIRHR